MAKPRVIEAINIENPHSTGESFEELFDQHAANTPEEGEVVKGRIVALTRDNATVDIGYKNEGFIPVKDFPFAEREALNIGDVVDVFLEKIDNSKAETVLSRDRAVREESWERLEEMHKKGEQVEGIIFSRVKGGFTVDLSGAIAFLPGSQVDVRPVKDISPLMNIKQPFVILKMDRARGNIVVSRRAILEESRNAEREEALTGISEGMVLDGVVKNITDYGAFIDLGAIDGLLHVTDIAWKRVTHPSEVLKLGETIKVKVIKFDQDSRRISLGIKQLEESPWTMVAEKYPEGSKHKGVVSNITDYGVFIELGENIEGLVHVSEMSWTKKSAHPNKIVKQGDEVEVMVLAVEIDKERLSLGMKQCIDNPWVKFAENHKKGEIFSSTVRSVTDFGLFVELEGGLEGLVHVSDISWDKVEEEALKEYEAGNEVKVKVLDIDSERERISLGIKQLEKDGESMASAGGTSTSKSGYSRGSVATFEVIDVSDKGIEVALKEGDKKAFIRKTDLSKERVECRPERFSKGDRVDAKITGFEKSGLPKLSIKQLEIDDEKKAIAEFGSADSGASLGGILGVALDSAKKEAEEAAKKKDK